MAQKRVKTLAVVWKLGDASDRQSKLVAEAGHIVQSARHIDVFRREVNAVSETAPAVQAVSAASWRRRTGYANSILSFGVLSLLLEKIARNSSDALRA